MKFELELPKEYEKLFKSTNAKSIVEKSLQEILTSEFKKHFLMNLLKEVAYKQKLRVSKISLKKFPRGKINKKALRKLSEEIKEEVAKRHGL